MFQCVDKPTRCNTSYEWSLLSINWLYMFRTITSPSSGASSHKLYNALVCSCYQASLAVACMYIYLYFNNVFRSLFLQVMWPVQFAFFLLIVCRIFLLYSSLFNTFSLLKRSVQLIFSILLRHRISKLSRYFWSTFWSVQVSAPWHSYAANIALY